MSKKKEQTVVKKDQEGGWKRIELPRGRKRFSSPTLEVTKGSTNLHATDLKAEQMVAFYSNGTKCAVVPAEDGDRQIKKKKNGVLTIPGKKVITEMGLKPGTYEGEKGDIEGQDGWIFHLA